MNEKCHRSIVFEQLTILYRIQQDMPTQIALLIGTNIVQLWKSMSSHQHKKNLRVKTSLHFRLT